MRKIESEVRLYVGNDRVHKANKEKEQYLAQDIRWLWYEFTPYEVGCDEIGGKFDSRIFLVAVPRFKRSPCFSVDTFVGFRSTVRER